MILESIRYLINGDYAISEVPFLHGHLGQSVIKYTKIWIYSDNDERKLFPGVPKAIAFD